MYVDPNSRHPGLQKYRAKRMRDHKVWMRACDLSDEDENLNMQDARKLARQQMEFEEQQKTIEVKSKGKEEPRKVVVQKVGVIEPTK